MTHRSRHAKACAAAFAEFCPDFSGCKNQVEAQAILSLAKQGYYSAEIAAKIGKTPKAIQKFFRRYCFPSLQNICPPLREERHGWKGGVKEAKGYFYSRTPGHPHASKHGNYVAVHRLVMEQTLGRFLLPTEVVDHIDGDTRNNHPSNLRVFQSNAEPLRETLKGRCPEWSDDGLDRLDNARRQPRRTWKGRDIQPIHAVSESDADQ
jgi:hypothetical protein